MSFKFQSLPGLTSLEVVEPSDGGHATEVEFSFLIIVKAWMMSLMVMFWETELSLKVSLSSIFVVDEGEEEDVNELKIDSNGISA